MDSTTLHTIHEAVGLCCILFMFYCNAQKDETKLLSRASIVAAAWSVNFALIGAWTASASVAVIGIRYRLASKGKNLKLFALFFAIHLIVGLATYVDFKDSLAITATLLGTASVFLCRGASMRGLFMIASTCWVAHHIVVGSMSGLAVEGIGIAIHATRLIGHIKAREFN